jgi:hypothetical protein
MMGDNSVCSEEVGMVVHQGRRFTSVQDVIDYANSFPREERYSVQAVLLEEMTRLHSKFGNAIESMYNYVVADGSYRGQVTERDFKEAWVDVVEIVEANAHVETRQQRRQKTLPAGGVMVPAMRGSRPLRAKRQRHSSPPCGN